jgi:hypothetical protein
MERFCQDHGWTSNSRNRRGSASIPHSSPPKGPCNRPIISTLPQSKRRFPEATPMQPLATVPTQGGAPCFIAAASNPSSSPIVAGLYQPVAWFLVAAS